MTLLTTRKKLVELSGRYDLVEDYYGGQYGDIGANWFIQAALKWLDSNAEHPDKITTWQAVKEAGSYSLSVKGLRSVQNIYLYDNALNSDIGALTEMSIAQIRSMFPKGPSLSTQGVPQGYAYTPRLIGSVGNYTNAAAYLEAQSVDYEATDYIHFDTTYLNAGLLIVPPMDKEYTVTVDGRFWSYMEADTDTCWWDARFSELLIQTSLFIMEGFYRNFAGARDAKAIMDTWLKGLDRDEVFREMPKNIQMRG